MTISSLTVVSAYYLRIGPICFVEFELTFICGGTAAPNILITLPFNSIIAASVYGEQNTSSLGWSIPVCALAVNSNLFSMYCGTTVGPNFPLGTTVNARTNMSYRVQ